jgi:TatD DNase family protein
MWTDTHCHLTFDALAPSVPAVLSRASAAGVQRVINVATSIPDARSGLALMASFENVWLVAGIHPHDAGRCTTEDLDALAALHRGQWSLPVSADRLVGVGETGLDFHYDFAPRDRQEEVFRFHLVLASEVGRPVVIHAREAEERVCDILAEYPQLPGRVVFHCYSAGVPTARRILDWGGWLSFTGVVTFKNAGVVRESARYAPLDRIMLETDAPYLAPEPRRKIFPNEPAFLTHTAEFVARLRGLAPATLAAATTANANVFFGLPEEQA